MSINKHNTPQKWSIKKLGDIFTLSAGGDVDKSLLSKKQDAQHPYPIYANALIDRGLYGYSSNYRVEQESITITGRGDIGKVFYRAGKYTPIVRLVIGVPKKGISAKYMSYACSKIRFFNETTGVSQLTVPQVAEYKVAVPPLPEQEKIAEILSCWDDAIEQMQNLIAEKKELRHVLAYKLLSGNLWPDTELCELLNYEQPSKYLVEDVLDFDSNKLPVLTANKSFIIGSTDDDTGVYDKGDCVIFDDFTTDMKYVNFKFKVKSSAIKILTPKSGSYLKFVFEQMRRIKYPRGGHKRYWLSEFQYLTIGLPDTATQHKIVNILSKADTEIDLLNKKLDVLKEQKRGLMQKLLTGEIRVKAETE